MNKVLRYTIEAVDKSAAVVQKAVKNIQTFGDAIRKAIGGISQWAIRELTALADAPKKMAIAVGLAAAAGRVWNNVIKAMIDRAKAAKELLADMVDENIINTIARHAQGYDRLKKSIEGAASAARQMSQAEGEREQAATAVAVTGLQAQKAEALAGMAPDDMEGRARVGAFFDKQIRAAEIESKAAEAARAVSDAEMDAAKNAERRAAAEDRIRELKGLVISELRRSAAAEARYAKEGYGVGDYARGTFATIMSAGDIDKGTRARFRDQSAAEKDVERSKNHLEMLNKELTEVRKDIKDADASSPVLAVNIEAAKTRQKSVENEKRIAAAEQASADAALKAARAREEYVESVNQEADALREQGRAHLQAASEYAAAAEQLSQKGAERFAQWESVGFRDMDAWRAEEAGKKAGLDDEAKYEKALKKAADRERRLGERSLKKSDKEILAFQKKREGELKKAADEANKAEQLRQREREERKAADTVQKEIRDLLKRNLQMDGGGNAGGPE